MDPYNAKQPVRLPPELASAPAAVLEEYVRARIGQFAGAFASRVNPTLSPQVVQRAANETIASLPMPELTPVAIESRDLQLVFRHDCLSLGCLDPQCVLCEHNPHRRCNVNFSSKYLVNDVLKAKCDASIRIEIIDRLTGVPLGEDVPDVYLEMAILDGNAYDAKCLESGSERDEDLAACELPLNNKSQPLLMPGSGGTTNAANRVSVQLSRGVAPLPDLHVSDSSEAMLSGRKPPFRLLVKAVHVKGKRINIRHAVSEGFVVATRRTRTAGKVEIPNVDDHVSKLEHMGKETVKKLQDLPAAAAQCGVELNVPDKCINKVGEFRKLAVLAEADGHLRQKLQQVLKLSKEKWDDARDHAMRAVLADNRMRIWYVDKNTMEVGLLFTTRLGNVDLDRPVGLLQKKSQEGAQTTIEATLMAQQTPVQREQVRQLQPQAAAAWWQMGHPGWAIYPIDSEQFMSTGALETAHMPTPEHVVASLPPPASTGGAAGGRGGGVGGFAAVPNPSFSGFGASPSGAIRSPLGGLPSAYAGGLDPAVGVGGGASPYHTVVPDGGQLSAQQMAQLQQMAAAGGGGGGATRRAASHAPPPPEGLSKAGGTHGGNQSSPFASVNAQKKQNTGAGGGGGGLGATPGSVPPDVAALGATINGLPQNLSMFGGQLPLNFSFSGFPSLPTQLQSGDLDAFLGPGGASLLNLPLSQRASSLGIGKLESMELPDAAEAQAAVIMLHDMADAQQRGGGTSAAAAGGGGAAPGGGAAGGGAQGGGGLQRMGSGLESMQSIEQALGDVNQVMDNVADGWQQRQQPAR